MARYQLFKDLPVFVSMYRFHSSVLAAALLVYAGLGARKEEFYV